MKIKRLIRSFCFLLIASLMVVGISTVVRRKTNVGAWNYMAKVSGFKNLPDNSVEVLIFGSSHAYCTINPGAVYNETKIVSYVLATQQQPLDATYYYVKEALKTQNPKLIVVEAYMVRTGNEAPIKDEGILHDAIDPLPFSLNKLRMINDVVPFDLKNSFYFDFIKYHSRWNTLSETDVDFSYEHEFEENYGYVWLDKVDPKEEFGVPDYPDSDITLTEECKSTLDRIRALCKEHGAEMMLLISPYITANEDYQKINAVRDYASENHMAFLDMNLATNINIDPKTDYYDDGHLNVFGADKASRYFANYVEQHFSLDKGYSAILEMYPKRFAEISTDNH